MTTGRKLAHDWDDGVIPDNLAFDDTNFIDTTYAFRRFRSRMTTRSESAATDSSRGSVFSTAACRARSGGGVPILAPFYKIIRVQFFRRKRSRSSGSGSVLVEPFSVFSVAVDMRRGLNGRLHHSSQRRQVFPALQRSSAFALSMRQKHTVAEPYRSRSCVKKFLDR
jgi:hypothetical protein